jgi:broad specificity phosphatase PhoE
MSRRTVVHLLRHGEVDNPGKVLYGRLPGFVLSSTGERMAEVAADALRRHDVVLVRSSPLERARQTAEPIARVFDAQVEVDERLIESENVFAGLQFGVGDGSLRRPTHWRHLRNPMQPSWGEPYAEVAARMLAAIADARCAARGHEVVLVSHQLPIWIGRRALEGRRLWHRPDRRICGLASVTSLTYAEDRLVSIGYREPAAALVTQAGPPGA